MAILVTCFVLLPLLGSSLSAPVSPGVSGVCPIFEDPPECSEQIQNSCLDDQHCPNYLKCCWTGCVHVCDVSHGVPVCPIFEDPAECPEDIEHFCTDDQHCPKDMKCCWTGCERDCVDPVARPNLTPAVSVPDPIALYPLNSKYETQEINNRQPHGTPVGVSLAPGPDGTTGGSYQFTGNANSYIEFPNNGGLDVQHSITMLCWLYPQNTDGPIFNYRTSGSWGVHMWMVSGKLFARFTYNDIETNQKYQFTKHLMSPQSLSLNQWHYVGSSYHYDTGRARLWLNGRKVAELNIGAKRILATQDSVRMGAKGGDGRWFNGRIAAFQVYNVALNAEQIAAVEKAGQELSISTPSKTPPTSSAAVPGPTDGIIWAQ